MRHVIVVLATPLVLMLLAVVVAAVPSTSSAGTIPLADSSTFLGTVDNDLLGPDRVDGFPNGRATGSITFEGELSLNSTVQVTELHFTQDFAFPPECIGGGGCPRSFQVATVTLDLERPGSVSVDGEGNASGQLRVTVSAEDQEAAATLLVNVFTSRFTFDPTRVTEDPRNPAYERLYVEGTLQFDNPESPLASLQGVALVPEPPVTVLLLLPLIAAVRWCRAGAERSRRTWAGELASAVRGVKGLPVRQGA